MKRIICIVVSVLIMLFCAGCAPEQMPETETVEDTTKEVRTLQLSIDGTEVSVEWENNESVEALSELVGSEQLSVQLSMYGGFEQVGSLGKSLPKNDEQMTTQAGDIVLYSGNQIVIFYGSNPWGYTRLGRITDKSGEELSVLLGNGDVTITISMD